MDAGCEPLVCRGGPMDGRSVDVARSAHFVEFTARVPMPNDGWLYTSWEQARMTIKTVTYRVELALAADGSVTRMLVPHGGEGDDV